MLVDEPPRDPADWIFEIKFDGYRMLARVEGGEVRLVTRNGNDWTARLPALQQALQAHGPARRLVRRRDHHAGRATCRPTSRRCRAPSTARAPSSIVYYLFDLPYCAGHDLRDVPLVAAARGAAAHRRAQAACQRALQRGVRRAAAGDAGVGLPARPGRRDRQAARLGLRRAGARSDWIKLKCAQRQEFVIGGWTDPKGSRTGIGSLLLGVHDDDGKLRYAGNVGTGFNERTLRDLRERLDALPTRHAARSTARHRACRAARTGCKPELVAEVSFGEWTRDGKIRHSVFHGLRTDKPADGDRARGAGAACAGRPTRRPRRRRPRTAKAAAQPPPPPRCPPTCASATPSAWSTRRAASPRSSWCATTRWWRR